MTPGALWWGTRLFHAYLLLLVAWGIGGTPGFAFSGLPLFAPFTVGFTLGFDALFGVFMVLGLVLGGKVWCLRVRL
jgi:hypothetical protein